MMDQQTPAAETAIMPMIGVDLASSARRATELDDTVIVVIPTGGGSGVAPTTRDVLLERQGWFEQVPPPKEAPDLPSLVKVKMGLFYGLVEVAREYAAGTDRGRMDAVLEALETEATTLHPDHRRELEYCRLVYMTHLLTGPILLRIRAALLPYTPVESPVVEEVLSWRRFMLAMHDRLNTAAFLAQAPVPALLRVTLLQLVNAVTNGEYSFAAMSLTSACIQVAKFDVVGGSELVNALAASMFPPAVMK